MQGLQQWVSHHKKAVIVSLIVLAVIGIATVVALWRFGGHSLDPSAQQSTGQAPVSSQAETDKTIHIAMMGDMLAHDSVNAQAKTANGYDYTPYFSAVKPLYANADIVFCNPETPVAGDAYGVSGYPTFNAPSAFARDLVRSAGCNVINLASNHQADKGQAGIDASLAVWKELKPFAYNGMNSSVDEQNRAAFFEVKGVKFAFVALADFSNTPLPHSYSVNIYHNTELAGQLIQFARKNAEVVLVSAHWGTEDSNVVNDDQKNIVQMFADAGATMIIGTGPHVEQPVEWITTNDGRRVPVWYSIGNMLSSQLGINGLTSGVALADIDVSSATPLVKNLAFAPTFMSYEWSAADKAAGNLLARHNLKLSPLSQADAQIKAMFGSSYSADERKNYLERVLDAKAANVTVQ